MTLNELIERLTEVRSRYAAGDLEVVCHDGLDPSDRAPVQSVDLDEDGNVRIEA